MANNQVVYKGRKVVVTGAASGMGESVAMQLGELGAEIYAMDIKDVKVPVKKYISLNLGDKASIDAAIAQLPEKIDHVFNCAGIAGTTYLGKSFTPLDVVTINYIGARYFVESLVPRLHEGSSILIVASIAGMNWRAHVEDYHEFLSITGFEEAQDYVMAHKDDPLINAGPPQINKPYTFSKECAVMYSAIRSWDLAEKKIRINTVSPGATQTPMHDDFLEIGGRARGGKMGTSPVGCESIPDQQASVMLMVNSDMADYMSGQDLQVDFGYATGVIMGRMKPMIAKTE